MYATLRIGSYYIYFLIGILLTAVGPLIPSMREEFSLSHSQVSQLFVFQGVGFALSVLLGGAAADRFDRRRLFVSGCVLLGTALALFALVSGWRAVVALFALIGLGFGLSETILNTVFIDLSHGEEGKGLNILHTSAAFGGIAGSFFSGLLLPFGWRFPLTALGVLLIAGAGWLGLAAYPRPRRDPERGWRAVRAVVMHPVILLLALLLAAYVGIEAAITGWTVSYSIESLGGSALSGAFVTSGFWLGLMIGRLFCSRLASPERHLRVLVWSSLGAGLSFLPIAVLPSMPVLGFSVFATGFCFGGLFPTAVAHAGALFPKRAGAATGFLFSACTLGGATVPAAVGIIADNRGLQSGIASLMGGIVLLVAVGLAAVRAEVSFVRRNAGARS
ncbi:MAG TPA: MFS transporter [Gemmatimonadales bacterium]